MNQFVFHSFGNKPQSQVLTLPDNLIAYWNLDEASGSAADSVGSNTLTADNAPVSMTGKVGNGRAFVAASQQRLKITSPTGLAPGTGDFSISMWFRYTGSVTNNSLLNWGMQSSVNKYIWILLLSGALQVQFVDGLSGNNSMSTGLTFTTNTWHHIVCVFNRDGNMTTYKNGVSSANNSITGHQGDFTPITAFALGNYGTSNSLPLDGALDEVKIWHRVLTASEVYADYVNGVNGLPLS